MNNNLARGKLFWHIGEALRNIKMEYNADFQFVFYTSLGKIVCDVEPPANKSSLIGFTDDPSIFSMDISAIFDDMEFDKNELFDCHLINAKNAVFYSNSTGEEIMRMNQIFLFSEQILGFTLLRKPVE